MTNDPRPMTAGVCGDPINQTKSPQIFGHWFRENGLTGYYIPLLVGPSDFDLAISALPRLGFRGVNVTIPHKERALALADVRSHTAQQVGAANTLTFLPDGTIEADNTDAFGFLENLRAGAPGWDPADGPVLLLGAGGAARAAVQVLLEAGAPEIRIANRTRLRAEALVEHFGTAVKVVDWAKREEAADGAATIVNSTSLGMQGGRPLDMRLDAAPSHALVTDMVYNPLRTDLLDTAQKRGLRIVDGLGMLLHQARPGFRRWFGVEPEVTEGLRLACLEAR